MKRYLLLSRPRFWLYTLGTFLVAVVASTSSFDFIQNPLFWWLCIYFTFPSNFLIYGLNDIADYETDKVNPKKQEYELLVEKKEWKLIIEIIIITHIPFLLSLSTRNSLGILLTLGIHIVLAYIYSFPPIRAKARPFLDIIVSGLLYLSAGLVGWVAFGHSSFPYLGFIAGLVWAMGMQAYSAIPDQQADNHAGICTCATELGTTKTLLFVTACFASAGIIFSILWHWYGIFLLVPYLIIMFFSYIHRNTDTYFKWYTYFPWINGCVGFMLFWMIILFS